MSDDTKKTEKPKVSKKAKDKASRAAMINQLSAAGFNGPQINALLAIFKAA